MPSRLWTFSFALVFSLFAAERMALARDEAAGSQAKPPAANPGSDIISGLITQLVRDQLKTEYVDDDDWGKTKRVTVGYDVHGKPFEWKVSPHTREVNHGLWEKYTVRLIDPDEHLQVQVARLEVQDGRLQFEISLSARLRGEARLERWRQGVKMLNTHVEAKGRMKMQLAGSVGVRLVADGLAPAVVLDPHIDSIDLKLQSFDLKRISKLEGKAAHELGDSLKGTIDRELERREGKIVAKLNRSIEKRKDKLRISPAEFARTGWEKLLASSPKG